MAFLGVEVEHPRIHLVQVPRCRVFLGHVHPGGLGAASCHQVSQSESCYPGQEFRWACARHPRPSGAAALTREGLAVEVGQVARRGGLACPLQGRQEVHSAEHQEALRVVAKRPGEELVARSSEVRVVHFAREAP